MRGRVARGLERAQQILADAREQARQRIGIDRDLEAELLQLRERQDRRAAALDHVGQTRRPETLGHLGQIGFAGRRLDEQDVGTGLAIARRALQRRLEAFRGDGVGAGHDHDVGIDAGVGGGLDALLHLP